MHSASTTRSRGHAQTGVQYILHPTSRVSCLTEITGTKRVSIAWKRTSTHPYSLSVNEMNSDRSMSGTRPVRGDEEVVESRRRCAAANRFQVQRAGKSATHRKRRLWRLRQLAHSNHLAGVEAHVRVGHVQHVLKVLVKPRRRGVLDRWRRRRFRLSATSSLPLRSPTFQLWNRPWLLRSSSSWSSGTVSVCTNCCSYNYRWSCSCACTCPRISRRSACRGIASAHRTCCHSRLSTNRPSRVTARSS